MYTPLKLPELNLLDNSPFKYRLGKLGTKKHLKEEYPFLNQSNTKKLSRCLSTKSMHSSFKTSSKRQLRSELPKKMSICLNDSLLNRMSVDSSNQKGLAKRSINNYPVEISEYGMFYLNSKEQTTSSNKKMTTNASNAKPKVKSLLFQSQKSHSSIISLYLKRIPLQNTLLQNIFKQQPVMTKLKYAFYSFER